MTTIPPDYEKRVYAGWLGKCIGVRFGAPLEGWTYEEIRDNLGPLDSYVREAPGKVFKPDDDTAFPMILIRALEDHGPSPDLTAQQISDTRLNYVGDQHGTHWWGGYGASSEHASYLNAANGIPAPRCGSIAQNGATLAEQIGGQIFSDIWGLVAPDNPALAADLAERAASITHDGNGIYGGRFVAALVSHAFRETNPLKLIDMGLSLIPADSEYVRVARAVLDLYCQEPDDWHQCYAMLKADFGYDRYPGAVHIIPNAGVVVMALAYSGGDFSRAIQIGNMAGWDTDCNVGNVGAIMGVAVGLEGIDSRWRDPMNDLLIASSIIGTRNILTIPQCVDLFCHLGRQLAGEAPSSRPRYHFAYPGSTQNFRAHGERGRVIHWRQADVDGQGVLQASLRKLNKKGESRLFTRTYYRPHELSSNYYEAMFSPLIYPGQRVTAQVYVPDNAPDTLQASLYVYDDNHGQSHQALGQPLTPGTWHTLDFAIPALENACLSEVGLVVRNLGVPWDAGAIYLAELDWDGAPDYGNDFSLERAESGGVSQWTWLRGNWRLEQDGKYHGSGPGLCESYSGDIKWSDYTFEAQLTPVIGGYHNINTRVGGASRSYAFGLAPEGKVALYKKEGFGNYHEVASVVFPWTLGQTYTLKVAAQGATLTCRVQVDDREASLIWTDDENAYLSGQVGFSTWHGGHTRYEAMRVSPVEKA